jgi:hypothetical protein
MITAVFVFWWEAFIAACTSKPFGKLLLDTVMGDALAFVQFPEPLANTGDKVDPLLNIVPCRFFRKILNRMNGDVFGCHAISLSPSEMRTSNSF